MGKVTPVDKGYQNKQRKREERAELRSCVVKRRFV